VRGSTEGQLRHACLVIGMGSALASDLDGQWIDGRVDLGTVVLCYCIAHLSVFCKNINWGAHNHLSETRCVSDTPRILYVCV
jgi:hypothetical protein